MGCKRLCIVDIGNRKCCMECERHEECNILCDDLDQYEYISKKNINILQGIKMTFYVYTNQRLLRKELIGIGVTVVIFA